MYSKPATVGCLLERVNDMLFPASGRPHVRRGDLQAHLNFLMVANLAWLAQDCPTSWDTLWCQINWDGWSPLGTCTIWMAFENDRPLGLTLRDSDSVGLGTGDPEDSQVWELLMWAHN